MIEEQLWLPCTRKERADIQFVCPECGKRDFRIFGTANTFHIVCSPCGYNEWIYPWNDETKLG